MAAREVRAGKAFVELGVKDKFTGALSKISAKFTAAGAGILKAGAGMTAFGAGLLGPLAGAGKLFADMGSAIFDASKRTGVAADQLSALQFAADQSGASFEDLEKGLKFMQKQGIGADQFEKLAKEVNAIVDPTKRAQRAMELWGKSGTMLIPMLDGLAANMKRARDLGLIIDPEQAAAADAFGDSLSEVFKQLKMITFQAGAAVAKALQPYADATTRILKTSIDWVKANGTLIVTIGAVAAGIVAAGIAVTTLGAGVFAVGVVLSGLAATVAFASAALAALLSPIGLVVAGLGVLTTWFFTSTKAGASALQWLGDRFNDLSAVAKTAFGGIADALMAGDIALAGKILWVGLLAVFQTGVTEIKTLWAGLFSGMVNVAVAVANVIQQTFFAMIQAVTSAIDGMQKKAAGIANVLLSAASVIANSKGATGVGAALSTANAGIQAGSNVASAGLTLAGAGASGASAEITATLDAISKFADTVAGASVSEAQATLETLKAELARLRGQAAEERALIEATPKTPTPPDIEDSISGIAAKLQSRGTFNAAAIQSLQSSPVQDRIAKAVEATARNTRNLNTGLA